MTVFRVRASLGAAVFLQVLISPLTMFGVYFLINEAYLGALVSGCVALYAWLDVRTSEIIVRGENISVKHFYREKNLGPCREIKLDYGRGGDIGLLPVVNIFSSSNNVLIGNLKRTYFSQYDVSRLVKVVSSKGAVIGVSLSEALQS